MKTKVKLIKWMSLVMIALVITLGVLKMNSKSPQDDINLGPVDEEVVEREDDVQSITLLSVGDFLYHRPQTLKNSPHPTGYDYYNNLQYVKPYLEAADITFGNYESTSTPTQPYKGYPMFNTPAESIDALADAGVDILSISNNHSLDTGKKGLVDTYFNIYNRGIIPVGAKLSPNENERVIVKKGIHVGFLAYTYGYNGLEGRLSTAEHEYMGSLFKDEARLEREVKASVRRNDFTVISLHWGNEYQIIPNAQQEALARKLVSWGVDVIIGGHPHVIQKSERIEDAYVIYSTGNFISDQRLETLDKIETERGIMLELELIKNFTTGETKVGSSTVHPTWVNKYKNQGRSYYEVIPTEDYLSGKITPYTPQGSRDRIQKAHDAVIERVAE